MKKIYKITVNNEKNTFNAISKWRNDKINMLESWECSLIEYIMFDKLFAMGNVVTDCYNENRIS